MPVIRPDQFRNAHMFIAEPDAALFIRKMDGILGTVVYACVTCLTMISKCDPVRQTDIRRRADLHTGSTSRTCVADSIFLSGIISQNPFPDRLIDRLHGCFLLQRDTVLLPSVLERTGSCLFL